MVNLWNICGISRIYGISMEYLWNIDGISMEYLWNIHGISMEYLGKSNNNLTTTETQANDGEWIRGIIPFYGRNMQVHVWRKPSMVNIHG